MEFVIHKERDTNGQYVFEFVDTINNDLHYSCNTIKQVYTFWDVSNKDYQFARQHVTTLKDGIGGFASLLDSQKDIVIEMNAESDEGLKMTYLTGKGMTSQQATDYLVEKWDVHNTRFIEALKFRWSKAKKKLAEYLSVSDMENVWKDIRLLVFDMITVGNLGTNYGDVHDGVMDYIESTGGYYDDILQTKSGMRTKGFTLKKGDWDTCEADLKDVIINGIY